MSRTVVIATVAAAVVVAGAVAGSRAKGFDWEKAFERMPDNAPPKWMFHNISAIRANTERILELLEREQRADGAAPPATD